MVEVAAMGMGTTLAEALADITPDDDVVLNLGAGSYGLTASVSGGAEVAFVGPSNAVLQGGGGFGLNVAANSIAYLSGIPVSNGADAGVRCVGTGVWLDDVVVDSNSQIGVDLGGCEAQLRRSRIVNNSGGGIRAVGVSTVDVENCYVGGDENNLAAVDLTNSTARISYSTLGAGFGSAAALTCDASTVDVEDSILSHTVPQRHTDLLCWRD